MKLRPNFLVTWLMRLQVFVIVKKWQVWLTVISFDYLRQRGAGRVSWNISCGPAARRWIVFQKKKFFNKKKKNLSDISKCSDSFK